jgi:hypothetical protein
MTEPGLSASFILFSYSINASPRKTRLQRNVEAAWGEMLLDSFSDPWPGLNSHWAF